LKENDSVVSKSNKDEVLQKMLKIMGYLEKYDSLTTTDHINILEKCINDIKDIINYLENTDNSTYVGKVVIHPIAINWRKVFESALDDKKKELLPRLLVELNPIYLTRSGAVDRCFTIQITNKAIVEGHKRIFPIMKRLYLPEHKINVFGILYYGLGT
jgi:hypothetical protein